VRNTWIIFAVACCALKVHSVSAEPVQLTGDVMKVTLPGSVLKLDTPLGMVVPIKFEGNGLMSGDAGQLASYLGSQKDRGRYWLAEDRICYKWFRWFSGEQHCLAIRRDGQRIYWQREDGETGTATLEESIKPAPAVTKPARHFIAEREREHPAADNVANLDEPVLVKLPTLAIRPAKPPAVVAEDISGAKSSGVHSGLVSQPR